MFSMVKTSSTTVGGHAAKSSLGPARRRSSLGSLQRDLGNQASMRMLDKNLVQAKLSIGQANDSYEREADQVADRVMRMPASNELPVSRRIPNVSKIQRACSECEENVRRKEHDDEEPLQAKGNPSPTPTVTPAIESGVQSLKGGGHALSDSQRAFFEPRFGADFSQVRIHTDHRSSHIARSINARAFAIGNNIAFGKGQFAPNSITGKHLLAHELTHVIQQGHAQPKQRGNSVSFSRVRLSKKNTDAQKIMRATRTYALTFDDGPHTAALGKSKNRTEKVLDTLKARNIKAGFFLQTGVSHRGASRVGRALVKRMSKEGHKIGIHTGGNKDHELHTKAQKDGRLKSELEAAKKYIEEQTNETPTVVRPPTGKSNKAVRETYRKVGLTNLLWDIDGDQGKNLSLAKLMKRIEVGIGNVQGRQWKGSTPSAPRIVVLYHDIQKNSVDHLGTLIDHIKQVTKKVSKNKDNADFGPP